MTKQRNYYLDLGAELEEEIKKIATGEFPFFEPKKAQYALMVNYVIQSLWIDRAF